MYFDNHYAILVLQIVDCLIPTVSNLHYITMIISVPPCYYSVCVCRFFKLNTPTCVSLSLCISSRVTILIGSDKSCDIRIIDEIIVRCHQGQMIQQV